MIYSSLYYKCNKGLQIVNIYYVYFPFWLVQYPHMIVYLSNKCTHYGKEAKKEHHDAKA